MKQTFNIHQKKQKYILNNIFIFIFSLDEYVYTRNIHSRSQRFEVKHPHLKQSKPPLRRVSPKRWVWIC